MDSPSVLAAGSAARAGAAAVVVCILVHQGHLGRELYYLNESEQVERRALRVKGLFRCVGIVTLKREIVFICVHSQAGVDRRGR